MDGKYLDISDLSKSVEEKIKIDTEQYQAVHTKEEIEAINLEHEKKMKETKKQDIVNKQLAILIDIENMIKLSIRDMLEFCYELEELFSAEFDGIVLDATKSLLENSMSKKSMYFELYEKIIFIKQKYFL